jgi:hypothetical protein
MPIPRFLCAPPPNHEKSRRGLGGALIPAEVFTHWERPPAEAQGRRDGNWTTNRRRPRLHGSSTESPLCASAPLRENLLRSLCAPPIRASPPSNRSDPRRENRQWGQICPFDICARSIVTKLRQRPLSEPPDPVRCRGVTHSTPPFPASQPTYRSDRREKIGSSSRRDATVRNCGIQAPFGPSTICQMDRSDPIAPFQRCLAFESSRYV